MFDMNILYAYLELSGIQFPTPGKLKENSLKNMTHFRIKHFGYPIITSFSQRAPI